MQFFIDSALLLAYIFAVVLIFSYIARFWVMYSMQRYLSEDIGPKSILLEIKLPREIDKSPQAFEFIASNLMQSGGVGSWRKRKLLGQVPKWFSLEIVSLEGVVHFYIWTHSSFRALLESNLYAQYPGIEVVLAPDYTKLFRYNHKLPDEWSMWGASYRLGESWKTGDKKKNKETGEEKDYEMQKDFLPIRTYVDLGLDKNPKEEYKNDPLTGILEYLGSFGKGEYGVVQLLLQDESSFSKGTKFPKMYFNGVTKERQNLSDMSTAHKNKIRNVSKKKVGDAVFDEYGYHRTRQSGKDVNDKPLTENMTYQKEMVTTKKEMDLTFEEKNELELISRKLSKPIARCILRNVYVAKPDNFNGGRIQQILSLFKPFAAPGFNSVGLASVADPYEYPWEDFMQRRVPWRKEELFDAFVERDGFHPQTGIMESLNGASWDVFFFPHKSYVRKIFNMVVEGLFHPFGQAENKEIFCLNTEEIATLFHFPGLTASVPTLPRIDSTKSEAPVGLPT